jgi:hypothetical protein
MDRDDQMAATEPRAGYPAYTCQGCGAARPSDCTCHKADVMVFPGVGRCDACDGPLDADYAVDEHGSYRVCSRCDPVTQLDALFRKEHAGWRGVWRWKRFRL